MGDDIFGFSREVEGGFGEFFIVGIEGVINLKIDGCTFTRCRNQFVEFYVYDVWEKFIIKGESYCN